MTRWQKVVFCILLSVHALIIYACIDGYYDTVIKNCASWGPGFDCPWGSEAMGVAWTDPYVYVSLLSRDIMNSMVCIIFALLAIHKKNYKVAIWFLALPLLAGFCAGIVETQLSNPILYSPSHKLS